MAAPVASLPLAAAPEIAPAEGARLLYEAVLHPHRSLPPRGFTVMMLGLAAVSFVAGTGFVLMGA